MANEQQYANFTPLGTVANPAEWAHVIEATVQATPENAEDVARLAEINNHDHDGTYAAIDHNHDGTYAAAGHSHSGETIDPAAVALQQAPSDPSHAARQQDVEQWENGTTNDRPSNPSTGQRYFDTDLGQPIWYDGGQWVDATGSAV